MTPHMIGAEYPLPREGVRGDCVHCPFLWVWVGGGNTARQARDAKTVKRPPQQPAQPQHANYWAPLTRKRYIPPHPAQPHYTNNGAPRTRKRHQQEHRPQRRQKAATPRNMRREEG